MTVFLALFRDAWQRARDRKSVTVLVAIGLVVALFCASLEFGRPEPKAALHDLLTDFSVDGRPKFGAGGGFILAIGGELNRPLVVAARDPVPDDNLPLGLENVAVADVEAQDLPDFDRVARRWRAASAARSGAPPQVENPSPRDPDDAPLGARERAGFLEGLLRDHGWETVIVRPSGEDDHRFRVAAATDHLAELEGRWKLSLVFRAYTEEMPRSTPAEWVVETEVIIANFFVGFVGMVIFLAAFCGAVPDLLQKGSLDLVLARPVGRARVLLFTYAGAVLTVLFVSAAIFLVCAVALGLRSGFFPFAFVACSLTAAAVFAMLYPVAMLFGLLTRNSTLAMLAGLGAWGLAAGLRALRILPAMFHARPAPWRGVVDALYWIAPKTSEMGLFDLTMIGKMQLSPRAYARLLEQLQEGVPVPDWRFVGGTSALFAATLLALTIAIFRRRDV